MIRIVSREILAATAAEEWKRIHIDGGIERGGVDVNDVHRRLVALGKNPHPKEVEDVIGARDFTTLGSCMHCDRRRKRLVEIEFGVGAMCEQVRLCEACLDEAKSLFTQSQLQP